MTPMFETPEQSEFYQGGPYRYEQYVDDTAFADSVVNSGKYNYLGVVFPTRSQIVVPGKVAISGTVKVEPGSFILSISTYSSRLEGFQLEVYEPASKSYIVQGQNIRASLLGADNLPGAVPSWMPQGPRILNGPWPVLGEGMLNITVTNLAGSSATIQVLLDVANKIRRI